LFGSQKRNQQINIFNNSYIARNPTYSDHRFPKQTVDLSGSSKFSNSLLSLSKHLVIPDKEQNYKEKVDVKTRRGQVISQLHLVSDNENIEKMK